MLVERCQYFQFELMWDRERCKFYAECIDYNRLNSILYITGLSKQGFNNWIIYRKQLTNL